MRLDPEPIRVDMQATNAITTRGGLVRTRWSICARQLTDLGLFLSLLLVGCAVVFVSSYDEVTDQQIQDAAKKTEVVIGDVLANRTSYSQHAKDYQEIEGALGALEMCAVNYQNNEAEVDLIQKLRLALRNLQRIHKEIGPFRQAEAEGVRSLFRSLIHHELSKKRSASINKTSQ
jgi:hypothetical protein